MEKKENRIDLARNYLDELLVIADDLRYMANGAFSLGMDGMGEKLDKFCENLKSNAEALHKIWSDEFFCSMR